MGTDWVVFHHYVLSLTLGMQRYLANYSCNYLRGIWPPYINVTPNGQEDGQRDNIR